MHVSPRPSVTRASTLGPYTTLFRSRHRTGNIGAVKRADPGNVLYPPCDGRKRCAHQDRRRQKAGGRDDAAGEVQRSEEHTSELQSPDHLVCRLLLEKKNKMTLAQQP